MDSPKGLAFRKTCKRCKRVLPLEAFARRRVSCLECLTGVPVQASPVLVPRWRRYRRRWWPKDVVSHISAWQNPRACVACGLTYVPIRGNQSFCSATCRRAGRRAEKS